MSFTQSAKKTTAFITLHLARYLINLLHKKTENLLQIVVI